MSFIAGIGFPLLDARTSAVISLLLILKPFNKFLYGACQVSLNHYKLYLEQVFQLAETLVIKSEDSARIINDRIRQLHGANSVDQTNPASWKYYLNLSGIYHPTDKKIIITSLDTRQEIEFSAANLVLHTATAKAYAYGTRYYRELVSLNPDEEQLILGVLYPVKITEAIKAPDFSVLGYPSHLVEGNEEELIPSINLWLENYRTRWYNVQYNNGHNLYLANTLGRLYQELVPLIITLRKKACKTSQAHSYHIREYLASHGMLDEYLDYMTKKQALFFYRNINYLERNAGKVETFNWILEKVLSDRDIPVNEVNLAQDDTDMLTQGRTANRFARQDLNKSLSADTSAAAFYTLAELLSKESNQAPGNDAYVRQNIKEIDETVSRSKTNFMKTKVLESRMIDYTDAGLYSIQDVALDHWCYMSANGSYSAVINFTDRLSNQNIAIPNHVAFLYYLYAFAQVNDIPLETVPEFTVTRIARDPVPDAADLAKVVDKKYVTEEELNYLLSLHTPLTSAISNSAFNDLIKKVHISYKAENMFAFLQNHIYKRALIKNASLRMYKAQRVVSPHMGKKFTEVFKAVGLPVETYGKDEWANVLKVVYEQATGIELNLTDNKAAMQSAMIKLFLKLSSYSIQFLSEINRSTIRSINWSAMRMGDIDHVGHDLKRVKLVVIQLIKKFTKSHDYRPIWLESLLLKFYTFNTIDLGFININLNTWKMRPVIRKLIDMGRIRLDARQSETCLLANPEGLDQFKPYFDLDITERHKVRDIYTNRVTDEDYIPIVDIDDNEFLPHNIDVGYHRQHSNIMDGWTHFYVPKSFEFRTDREFTDLYPAFESNFGDFESNRAFRPFVGFIRGKKSFKLTPGAVEQTSKAFKYSGGLRYNPGFGYSDNLDQDTDLGDFRYVFIDQEIGNMTMQYDVRELTFQYNVDWRVGELGSFTFKLDAGEVGNFNMVMDQRTLDMGELIAGSMVLEFKFNPNPKEKMDIFFRPEYDFFELTNFNMEVGTFQLGNFNFQYGVETMHFQFNWGTSQLGSFQIVNMDQEIPVGPILIDDRELDDIDFAAGSTQLGKYIYEATPGSINDYKWSGQDIEVLLFNWKEMRGEIEEMEIVTDDDGQLEFGIPEQMLDNMDFGFELEPAIELGDVTYDPVNKETEII